MISDEGSGNNFFYGPSVMVPYREPFANECYECYSFGDSRYHACGKYADLEKNFLIENDEVKNAIFSIQMIFLAWIQMKTWLRLMLR